MSSDATCIESLKTDEYAQVLLEAPFDPIRRQMNSVLLTIDLTKAVADEAIERKDCVVVSYRTLADPDTTELNADGAHDKTQ